MNSVVSLSSLNFPGHKIAESSAMSIYRALRKTTGGEKKLDVHFPKNTEEREEEGSEPGPHFLFSPESGS